MNARIAGILPILDVGTHVAPARAPEAARALLGGGARMLQLRAKDASARELLALARTLRAITREHGALFFVNDRPDIALLAEADGVHLGQTDLPARDVRRWLPEEMLIGVSCHNEAQLAEAVSEGIAAYAGLGPIYATTSKANPDPIVGLERLNALARAYPGLPIVAIGGITLPRLAEIRRTGARAAAMISALYQPGRELSETMRAALQIFERG